MRPFHTDPVDEDEKLLCGKIQIKIGEEFTRGAGFVEMAPKARTEKVDLGLTEFR